MWFLNVKFNKYNFSLKILQKCINFNKETGVRYGADPKNNVL